jgi:hypothetical protein
MLSSEGLNEFMAVRRFELVEKISISSINAQYSFFFFFFFLHL